jgi:2-dehydro-3-deoxygalactonokinase
VTEPQLIALDWGTSNLRASLLGTGGRVLAQRAGASGIMAVPERRFAEALLAVVGDWLDEHKLPLIASGMIGSRQGWREAPYLACPASRADAAHHVVTVPVRDGAVLHIAPGLQCTGADGEADVMRGEETQVWGAGLAAGTCCVLPGTHSKWAWTGAGDTIERFSTYMTGELYALLTQHSILGRLMRFEGPDAAAFERGAALGLAAPADVMHTIFAARTAGLMERLPAASLPDFLSGILIGAEIGSATRNAKPARLTLLGEAALCGRYAAALKLAGIAAELAGADATTRGQWQIAGDAGLVKDQET